MVRLDFRYSRVQPNNKVENCWGVQEAHVDIFKKLKTKHTNVVVRPKDLVIKSPDRYYPLYVKELGYDLQITNDQPIIGELKGRQYKADYDKSWLLHEHPKGKCDTDVEAWNKLEVYGCSPRRGIAYKVFNTKGEDCSLDFLNYTTSSTWDGKYNVCVWKPDGYRLRQLAYTYGERVGNHYHLCPSDWTAIEYMAYHDYGIFFSVQYDIEYKRLNGYINFESPWSRDMYRYNRLTKD